MSPGPNGHANGLAPVAPDSMRLPPHNLEAERGAIGSMLLDPATIDTVLEHCNPADFYRDSHRTIVAAIADLRCRGVAVDPITLGEELSRRRQFDDVGGHPALAAILEATPHAANAEYYARIVRQKAVARALIDAANQTLLECYSDEHAADALAEAAERRFYAVAEAQARGVACELSEAVPEAMATIRRRATGEVEGVGSGLDDLDDLTGGFRPGTLTVVAARPSMGKTAIVMNICEYAASMKITPLLFSLEMGRAELAERLLQARARVDGYRLRWADHLSADDWARLDRAEAELVALTFPIDDGAARTVSQVAALARRAVSRRKVGIVAVDYLQLLDVSDGMGRGESRQEQVARISRRLKTLARELGIPVIALSQLNRMSESREDRRPRLSDLRDSGAIEQDADVVILLHRPDYYDPDDSPGMAEAIVAKNRNGRTGTAQLVFLKAFARFESAAPAVDSGTASPNEPVF